MEIRFRLIGAGDGVRLIASSVDRPHVFTNLVTFHPDGRITRHLSVNPAFGLSLDHQGRLNIHG